MFAKSTFYTACQESLTQRMAVARAEMQAAQESSNSDTKSSAGDKYETGREMAQQERGRHAAQLQEAQQQFADLQKLNPALACEAVRLGALVATSLGLFYVSIGAGRLRTADGQDFLAVSMSAPIMAALSGKRVGDEVVFNGKKIEVLAIS